MSVQGPKFEKAARLSLISLALTVSASGVEAGENPHASVPLLAEATTQVTPYRMDFVMASFNGWKRPPARLAFATAGFLWLKVIQSTPATTASNVPLPEQSSTRT